MGFVLCNRSLVILVKKNRLAIEQVLKSADLLERPGKSQANCCLHIDRSGDIRLMGNISSNLNGLRVFLHEVGHAVYESKLSAELPFSLRQPAHIFLSEAVALLFERLKEEEDWLKEMGISGDTDRSAQKAYRDQRLVRLYWTMTVVKFERELYRNPEGSLNEIW
ncbi:hypothetical protein [Cohnella soli]|uniref:IrrE N-terminal-like domain-containing protein n=1 Tax=Cohnella soli TaxID=425005 RepID=A0ABW0I4P4_9BACL